MAVDQESDSIKFQKGSVLRDLPVFWDSDLKLLRLQSRMHTSTSLTFNFKNPYILPKCEYAQRLAVNIHQKLKHASQKQTYEFLRQTCWQLGGYNYVKSAVRLGCKTPRCRYIKFEAPKMSPLPTIRMDAPEAWAHVGVDYFGPIYGIHDCESLKCPKDAQGRACKRPKKHKIWGALFTCMHTRAIHVELVPDCSTKEFLEAFRRFVNGKGRPLTFYSDNATTFKSADRQLKELLKLRAEQDIRNHNFDNLGTIEWRYSTETAPWTNGCTERLVGLFKKQLMIALQKHAAPFRRLETLCMEIANVINERPLGQVIEGETERMITPNMLVTGRYLRPFLTPNPNTTPMISVDKMWEHRKITMLQFWKKWQSDYLSTLSVDNKWAKGNNPVLKPGDVVILKAETQEKGQWRLARVLDIHENRDGAIDTVSVQLSNKAVYKRSVRQVALLEPSAERLERERQESPESASPTPRGKTYGTELTKTALRNAGRQARGAEDSHSVTSPYPKEGGADSGVEYTGAAEATSAAPDSLTAGLKDPSDDEDPDGLPRKRARRHKGYYRQLAEGLL